MDDMVKEKEQLSLLREKTSLLKEVADVLWVLGDIEGDEDTQKEAVDNIRNTLLSVVKDLK